MTDKTMHHFPLGQHHRDDISAKSGRKLSDDVGPS